VVAATGVEIGAAPAARDGGGGGVMFRFKLTKMMADKRGEGEWFNLSEKDIADIQAIQAYAYGYFVKE
jgi:hypothetical protein